MCTFTQGCRCFVVWVPTSLYTSRRGAGLARANYIQVMPCIRMRCMVYAVFGVHGVWCMVYAVILAGDLGHVWSCTLLVT